jgi:hypothetical protein
MRKILTLFAALWVALILPEVAKAAPKTLFVNDNGLIKANTDTVMAALSAAGIEYDVFNARDSLRSPTAVEMQAYALVIWYCSTDGVKNYLWNATDTDNAELTLYLETGGRLWLMGSDFLYDRYSGAPEVFHSGDFVYDYLGIASYDAQSYGDDGGTGVPELDPVSSVSMGMELDTLQWIFPTAWWVDGCTGTSEATTVYTMGPSSYALQGLSAGLYNHIDQYSGERELTYFFDPAIVDTYAHRVHLFMASFSSFFLLPPGFEELPGSRINLIAGANPATDMLECSVPDDMRGKPVDCRITDFSGRTVLKSRESGSTFGIGITTLKPGAYFLSLTGGQKSYTQKFIRR